MLAGLSQAKISPGGIGYWQFKKHDRPIKAVIIGGSISAYTAGNFGEYLEAACPKLEVVNKAKSRLGAHHLYQRFQRQVLRNPRLNLKAHETWLLYHGGLNSVGAPHRTNDAIRKTFLEAHQAGIKVVGLSLLPWGSERDRRWRGARGLKTHHQTRLVVDFVLGRLKPKAALGYHYRGVDNAWAPGELPLISVDLYDTMIRDAGASRRTGYSLARSVKRNPWVKSQLANLSAEDKDRLLGSYVEQAHALPQWFMRKDIQYMDHFHPNSVGHRMMAGYVCDKLPPQFACQCQKIASMRWKRGKIYPMVVLPMNPGSMPKPLPASVPAHPKKNPS